MDFSLHQRSGVFSVMFVSSQKVTGLALVSLHDFGKTGNITFFEYTENPTGLNRSSLAESQGRGRPCCPRKGKPFSWSHVGRNILLMFLQGPGIQVLSIKGKERPWSVCMQITWLA